jgi:nucleoside-diphosphate-sugar epimerase
MMESLIGKKARVEQRPAHPADMLANWANVDKVEELLGWQPRISLEEGVNNLVAWYEAERSWASQVRTE